jgi:hypothetical protein
VLVCVYHHGTPNYGEAPNGLVDIWVFESFFGEGTLKFFIGSTS